MANHGQKEHAGRIPDSGGTRLVQTAHFAPTGFLGWTYWCGTYPLHELIFNDLVDAVARDATDLANRSPSRTRADERSLALSTPGTA